MVIDDVLDYRLPLLRDDSVVAVQELDTAGTLVSSVLAYDISDAARPGAPVELAQLADNRQVFKTHDFDGGLLWLEANKDGRAAALDGLNDADQDVCPALAIGDAAVPLQVRYASFSGDQLSVGGQGRFSPEAWLYQLATDANGCPLANLVDKRKLPSDLVTATFDDGDLLVWHEPFGTGGALEFFDMRDVATLYPGGRLQPSGFDVDADSVVVSLAPIVGTEGSRLLELAGADNRAIIADTTDLRLHPTFVVGGLVTLRVDATGAQALLRQRGLATASEVPLDGSVPLFADAPDGALADPLLWALLPTFVADDSRLAVVGYGAGGERTLNIFDVPADSSAWAGLVPSFEQAALSGSVNQVFLSGDVVVVTKDAGPSQVFALDAGSWQEVDADLAELAVVGAVDGQLAVLASPGNLLVDKAPEYATLSLMTPQQFAAAVAGFDGGDPDAGPAGGDAGPAADGGADVDAGVASEPGGYTMRLPAETFAHRFSTIGRNDRGDLLLYDTRAQPAVLWRVDAKSGYAVSTDSSRRPLNKGAEAIGVSGTPRFEGGDTVYIRSDSAGRALFRSRKAGE